MSIHNTLFFKDPQSNKPGRVKRYGTQVVINKMTDDDFRTHSSEADIEINIADGTVPTGVDYIFLKYIGDLTSYVVTPTGGSGSAFTRDPVPAVVQNAEGTDVSVEVDGFKHDLYEVPSALTATQVRIQFVGTGVQIVQLMVLELGLEINANGDWSRILPYQVDRAGQVSETPAGDLSYEKSIGAEREKWEYDLTLLSIEGRTEILYKDFLYWKAANRNCAFAREFTRFPEEVLLVMFPQSRFEIQPRNPLYKGGGDRVPFRLVER